MGGAGHIFNRGLCVNSLHHAWHQGLQTTGVQAFLRTRRIFVSDSLVIHQIICFNWGEDKDVTVLKSKINTSQRYVWNEICFCGGGKKVCTWKLGHLHYKLTEDTISVRHMEFIFKQFVECCCCSFGFWTRMSMIAEIIMHCMFGLVTAGCP